MYENVANRIYLLTLSFFFMFIGKKTDHANYYLFMLLSFGMYVILVLFIPYFIKALKLKKIRFVIALLPFLLWLIYFTYYSYHIGLFYLFSISILSIYHYKYIKIHVITVLLDHPFLEFRKCSSRKNILLSLSLIICCFIILLLLRQT